MRKSTIVVLVLSILLLVAGLGLSVYGVYLDSPHYTAYRYGNGFYSYSVHYRMDFPGQGNGYTEFGRLVFDSGLIAMAIFVILYLNNRKDEKIGDEKAAAFDERDRADAKANAVDAEIHEEEKKE